MENINNRNVVESVQHNQLTKKEIMKLIDETFPDEEVGSHGPIAQIATTKMTDGTVMQAIVFGKVFDIKI